MMRVTTFVCALLISVPGVAFAQEWVEYRNTQDGFMISFPGKPTVTNITWTSETGLQLPGRVYSVERGREKYSVTVADYTNVEQVALERSKNCPVKGFETCEGGTVQGIGYWKHDTRGAIIYATRLLMMRDVKTTELTWGQMDLVEGHYYQSTSNVDGARTVAFIGMNQMKLFIFEATVPKDAPQPFLFQVSQGWVDKDGNRYRYRSMYNNQFHEIEGYPEPGYNITQD
jgi:hypothetical protein